MGLRDYHFISFNFRFPKNHSIGSEKNCGTSPLSIVPLILQSLLRNMAVWAVSLLTLRDRFKIGSNRIISNYRPISGYRGHISRKI